MHVFVCMCLCVRVCARVLVCVCVCISPYMITLCMCVHTVSSETCSVCPTMGVEGAGGVLLLQSGGVLAPQGPL